MYCLRALPRLPTRLLLSYTRATFPQVQTLAQPLIHRPLATASKPTGSSTPNPHHVSPNLSQNPTKIAAFGPLNMPENHPYAEFYHTTIDLGPHFSCDWPLIKRWFFAVKHVWHDLSEMEFLVHRVAHIEGTIRPLAFVPDSPEPLVLFEAGGEYYYLNTLNDYWESYGGNFASHDAFLAAFVRDHPPLRGVRYYFPEETDELYAAVCEEQEARATAAAAQIESRRSGVV
ncbi:hypothetical protein MSAN_02324500 [Mycena sanguinolenta]|uniref:Uncharacterized protein n=1 Tax=Mycena sanguinolenta TaxID=230812 RepID=A0A8H7CGV6_9AGAR|nr:hypothetical protein MSAN_02324500 [Mycena sanguinolenta]